MSGLGIMVLTLLFLVSMATNHQDGGGRRQMPGNMLNERVMPDRDYEFGCFSSADCEPGQECCAYNLHDEEGYCDYECEYFY
uniref:Conotoxin O3 superfamily protein n=1 Tax=Conus miles TaxID=69564 RepID=A0AA50LSS1_CONMI|nr:conotoxin precursor O3 superfamily protein [Conus miles]